MIYDTWGFTSSPFQTTALPASEFGERLLVGRDNELKSLKAKLIAPPKYATLEGLNGVGKTSIVNVAGFQLFKAYQEGVGPLYVPCSKIFQLNPDQSLYTFIDQVLMEVAQTMLSLASKVRKMNPATRDGALDRWLNSPQLNSFQAGALGAQAGYQSENSTTKGFEQSGFRKQVVDSLAELFPTERGGIICTIDNLELLQSSDKARQLLEQLRDELFNVRGLRWVLCGALGIVYGVVDSPRLQGYLHKPIEVGGIGDHNASEILTSRVETYAKGPGAPYLPLRPEDFAEIYELQRGNLRSVLNLADDYCQWVSEQPTTPTNDTQREYTFNHWLRQQAEDAYNAVRKELRPKATEVFSIAVELGGVFSPGDFEAFGFNSIAAFRPHIRDLESVQVLVSTQDDGDKRRKTIQVTPKGWMVNRHLQMLAKAADTSPKPNSAPPSASA